MFCRNLNPQLTHQSGFKAGHSTMTAILDIIKELHTAGAACLSSIIILLDFSAAFETVKQQILLSALSLFTFYLKDHTCKVT